MLCAKNMLDNFLKYFKNGSGCRLKEIVNLQVHIYDKPLGGISYVYVPKSIKDKKAVINVKNNDEECFKWAMLRAIFPVEKNADRISDLKD